MNDWIEPTPRVRWGNPRWRYGVGLVTIVLGAAATNLTSTYSLWFLLLGPLVQLVGWMILPGALWRRLFVLLPCLVAALVLVAGPDFMGAFAVLLAGWLFARHRPPLSYLAVVPVIVLSFVLKGALNEYGQNWIGLVSGTLTTVACAWLGRALAIWRWHRIIAWRARRARNTRGTSTAPGPADQAYGPASTVPAGASAALDGHPVNPE
ncbi:hypothetical protein BJQ94_15185 [Cryobacterium sp. SO2]|uniref:hypothetical protein n=1 Tax=Cryobacterium sp. SO2 TaxID=1897060 RepID=UPI00223DF533|nr:hypothetical protein [Cryobacterium sp. SO2]WEO76689.1 hypothetical protein BJQ94_15185 [Cryobacterium sp. SO2]